jgi:hypothetical protein
MDSDEAIAKLIDEEERLDEEEIREEVYHLKYRLERYIHDLYDYGELSETVRDLVIEKIWRIL